jgi:hypothetical protein
MQLLDVIKVIVIAVLSFICISVALQLYYQTPSAISPKVRMMMYKQQQLEKMLEDKYTHPTPPIEDQDIYDRVSIGIHNVYEMLVERPFTKLADIVYGMLDTITEPIWGGIPFS